MKSPFQTIIFRLCSRLRLASSKALLLIIIGILAIGTSIVQPASANQPAPKQDTSEIATETGGLQELKAKDDFCELAESI